MKRGLVALYHQLPYPARVAVASTRGARLMHWRYGRETPTLLAEARERDTWSVEAWNSWQDRELGLLLRRAASVPHYRMVRGVGASVEPLEVWPILAKQSVREAPRTFLVEGANPRRMFEDHTSGTTGTPVVVWLSRQSVRRWYALFEHRARNWYGVSRSDRWAIVGGQLVVPASETRPPFWVWNAAARQLYLSAFHISPDTARHYRDALVTHNVQYVLGYPSSLAMLAREMDEQNLDVPSLAVVVTNAEPLLTWQRSILEAVFRCPVRDTYGMSEAVVAGSECEAGSLHLWPDAGVVEVLRDDEDVPAEPGDVGRLVCTGLVNRDMPLVRYETGDRGAVTWRGDCSCGRQLPILESIQGRMDDVVFGFDGRRVGRLDGVFKADLPIKEAQIVQERIGVFRVLVVPAAGYGDRAAEAIREALRDRTGPAEISVEAIEAIPRSRNGKFRAVVSNVAAADASR